MGALADSPALVAISATFAGLVVAVWLPILLTPLIVRRIRLARWRPTQAVIEDVRTQWDKRAGYVLIAKYRYQDGDFDWHFGSSRFGSVNMPGTGDVIPVRYDPHRHGRSISDLDRPSLVLLALGVVVVVIAAVVAGMGLTGRL